MKTESEMNMKDERTKLTTWLDNHPQYEFLWNEEDTLHNLRRTKEAVEALDKILDETKRKILAVGNKFRRVGVGDTATDEAIVRELYRLIH